MKYDVAGLSAQGGRDDQQDAWFISRQKMLGILDGAGGYQGGALASGTARQMLELLAHDAPRSRGKRKDGKLAKQWLAHMLSLCNYGIQARKLGNRKCREMCSTVVLATRMAQSLYIAHLGDSRAYLFRNGKLKQITKDHGEPDNVITRWLGDAELFSPDINQINMRRGDTIVLCTDGLHGFLKDAAIKSLLELGGSADEICQRLVQAALAVRTKDNVTVLALKVS